MNLSTEELIHRHLDDTLSGPESAELNARLKEETGAPERFAKIASLHQALSDGFQSGTLSSKSTSKVTAITDNRIDHNNSFISPWKFAAAAAIVLGIYQFVTRPTILTPINQPEVAAQEIHDTGFAVLTRVIDARWTDSNAPNQGDFLSADSFSLESGLVQIEFLSGVSLVVEGDAEFEILSSEEMYGMDQKETHDFGRTPDNNKRGGVYSIGRGHNADAMTMLMAGGGTKSGVVGATDDIGAQAVDVVHLIRDFHCTLLHLLGLDDNKLTYFHGGRYKQLSQFGGKVIPELLA